MTAKELIALLRSLDCDECPYSKECREHTNTEWQPCMLFDKAADSLEALASELEAERHRHDRYVDFELAEAAELAKAKAERDALLKAFPKDCTTCKHFESAFATSPCSNCVPLHSNWECRGVNPNAD